MLNENVVDQLGILVPEFCFYQLKASENPSFGPITVYLLFSVFDEGKDLYSPCSIQSIKVFEFKFFFGFFVDLTFPIGWLFWRKQVQKVEHFHKGFWFPVSYVGEKHGRRVRLSVGFFVAQPNLFYGFLFHLFTHFNRLNVIYVSDLPIPKEEGVDPVVTRPATIRFFRGLHAPLSRARYVFLVA